MEFGIPFFLTYSPARDGLGRFNRYFFSSPPPTLQGTVRRLLCQFRLTQCKAEVRGVRFFPPRLLLAWSELGVDFGLPNRGIPPETRLL